MNEQEKRELLEMAAEACKKIGMQIVDTDKGLLELQHSMSDELHGLFWNPLESNADCFEMECKLGIDVCWYETFVQINYGYADYEQLVDYADHNNDKAAARRYASTKLAAEIGKAMQ